MSAERKMIAITKEYLEGGYEIPDVYCVGGEQASAILGRLYRNDLEAEEKGSPIPVDHECTLCGEDEGYAQIVWTNGDIQRYFIVDAQDMPEARGNGVQAGKRRWA